MNRRQFGVAMAAPMMFLLAGIPLRAQATAPPAAITQQPAEPPAASFAFDVATFKPSAPASRGFGGGFLGPGYYSVTNFELSYIVFLAYFPTRSYGHPLIGKPAWADQEHYDVVAHEATTRSSPVPIPVDGAPGAPVRAMGSGAISCQPRNAAPKDPNSSN